MPTLSQSRLTKRLLDSSPSKPKEFYLWDREVRGFGVRIKPSGTKTFILKYRNPSGKQRLIALGQYGQLTIEQARKIAQQQLGTLASGVDPYENMKRSARLTVEELCLQYYADAEAGKVLYRGRAKKPSTLAIDRGRIHRHITPLLGKVYVKDLNRHQVENFMHDVIAGKTAITEKTKPRGVARVTGGPGTAKHAVLLLAAIYSYAIRKGMVENNPCRDIDKPVGTPRVRFLNSGEYRSLGLGLGNAIEHRLYGYAPHAILVAALTGCRRNEVLTLERSAIDAEGRCLRFSDTKTGAQMRPCGRHVLEILQEITAGHTSDWVFPTYGNESHIVNIKKPMDLICAEGGVSATTPHTLRHSYATVAHELGYSELTIAGLLGHRAGSVTGRYAHHVDYALANVADRVCETILRRLGDELHQTLQMDVAT